MRVLVTGHNGYIGSVMTGVLQDAGHTVVGLDTYYYEDCTLGEPPTDIEAIRKDMRAIKPYELRGFDAVIHLAALSNDPLGDLKADWTYEINHHTAVWLARMAKKAGVQRFLFASSCSIYGAAGDDARTEGSPLAPLTHYATSKICAEQDLRQLADEDFSPVFLRNATVYGVSPRMRVDLVLNNLVGWAYTTGKVLIMSDGMAWRPLIHVRDLCQAFAVVLLAPREAIHCQAFNIGTENYQIRELATVVEGIVPDCKVEYEGLGAPDARNYRVDFAKFSWVVDSFVPQWPVERGTQELYEAYRGVNLSAEEFQGRKYTRLKQLQYLITEKRLDENLRWRQPND